MGRADAALVLARYAVLRARYLRVSTQYHLGRYQCMACIFNFGSSDWFNFVMNIK